MKFGVLNRLTSSLAFVNRKNLPFASFQTPCAFSSKKKTFYYFTDILGLCAERTLRSALALALISGSGSARFLETLSESLKHENTLVMNQFDLIGQTLYFTFIEKLTAFVLHII
jgi:hypothetical protein